MQNIVRIIAVLMMLVMPSLPNEARAQAEFYSFNNKDLDNEVSKGVNALNRAFVYFFTYLSLQPTDKEKATSYSIDAEKALNEAYVQFSTAAKSAAFNRKIDYTAKTDQERRSALQRFIELLKAQGIKEPETGGDFIAIVAGSAKRMEDALAKLRHSKEPREREKIFITIVKEKITLELLGAHCQLISSFFA